MKSRSSIQRLLFLLCAGVFSTCAVSCAQSSVPFTKTSGSPGSPGPYGSAGTLHALNAEAKDGQLEGPSSAAWFSFNPAKVKIENKDRDTAGYKAAEESLSIEIAVHTLTASPVQLSLGLVTPDDLTSRGTLVSKSAPRSLSVVDSASGITRIRMVFPPNGTGAAITGFAVQLTGAEGTKARIISASIEFAETGWQKTENYFWAGFPPEGGRIDLPSMRSENEYPSVFLPRDSVMTLFFGAGSVPMGTIAAQGRTVFSANAQAFAFRQSPDAYTTAVPSLIFPKTPVKISVVSGGAHLDGMRVSCQKKASVSQIDPHMMIEWPWEEWRKSGKEFFFWDRFPSILIFDTADYAVQDKYFKRLAFFTEKKGYKGKLWADSDIASLHGFNAHDYRSESLASFFDLAVKENFPLNAEELELRDILLSSGILKKEGSSYVAGKGALLSISRESASYLRYMLIAHEGYHGIYFIDPEFRGKVSEVYNSLDKRALAFLAGYFTIVDSLGYDVNDQYLMENEFMGYLMQQPLEQIQPYFTGTILERFIRYGGDPDLAEYIRQTKASEFVRAGTELNEYVFTRWGLAGGRTGLFIAN